MVGIGSVRSSARVEGRGGDALAPLQIYCCSTLRTVLED